MASIKDAIRALIPHPARSITMDPKRLSSPTVVPAMPTTTRVAPPPPVIVSRTPNQIVRKAPPPPFDPTTESEPIHVSASVLLQPGATQSPNAVALTNPNGTPMVIYEIAFTLVASSGNVNTKMTGAAVGVKLDLGSYPITKDFCPLNLLGAARNIYAESPYTSPAVGGPYQSYVWRLPCPIFVPAGAVVVPQFQHRNLTTDSIIATIGYSGRSLAVGARPPKRVRLPYAASWISKAFDTLGAADTDQSAETDLANVLTRPLFVSCLIGRVNTIQNLNGWSSSLVPGDFIARLLTVRIADSYGHGIVPQPVPFSQVFCPEDSVFPAGFLLDSGAQIRAFIAKAAPTRQNVNAYSSQALISLNGYYEVEG